MAIVAAPGAVEEWSELVTRVLAPNPGPMTLDGTNSYIVRDPGSHRIVVVDPGPSDLDHLDRLQQFGRIELILLTHGHADHAESARELSSASKAPVRAREPRFCVGGAPLVDGEWVFAGGCRMRIIATPGHTADSMCVYLPDDRSLEGSGVRDGTILAGDTILGRGTTMLGGDESSLAEYLHSVERLREYGNALVAPGHGPAHASIARTADRLAEHRRRRLAGVRRVLLERDREPFADDETVALVTDVLYGSTTELVRRAAESSVRAQLHHLSATGRAVPPEQTTASVIDEPGQRSLIPNETR